MLAIPTATMIMATLITVGVMVQFSLWDTDHARTSQYVKNHNQCLPTALMWINFASFEIGRWISVLAFECLLPRGEAVVVDP